MKNLKKVLAFVIAFTMMLGFSVSASIFPDVEDNASYAEAVTILSSLKIMVGDDTGNFRPDDTITRAEVAAIVVRTLGLEDASNGAKGTTNFTDVAADHWATGYINLATQKGIIAGYGDGTFGPEDPVQYEQATKMIVAALGYAPKADAEGGYPTGYLVVASQEGIAKGATGTSGEPAKRSVVARLVFNALDVKTMEQTGFKPGEPEYEVTDKTLLSSALKVDKYEGIITATYLTKAADKDDKSITIDYIKVNDEKEEDKATFDEGAVDAASLFGMHVVAYVQDNEDDEATIIAVAPKSGKNSTITLDYAQIENVVFDEDEKVEVIEYVDGSVEDELTIAASYKSMYNGKAGAVEGWLEDPTPGNVTLIDNDNDDEYEYIMVNNYTGNYLVDSIDVAAGKVEDKEGRISAIDVDDEDTIISFFMADGTAAAFEDIQAGDVLTLVENGSLVKVYISRNVVSGKVTEERTADGEKVFTIAGNEYRLASDEISVTVGEEGDFYLNIDNRIVAKDAARDVTIDKYAYMFDAVVESGIGGATATVKFFTATGEWKTIDLAKKVTVYEDEDFDNVTVIPAEVDATSDLGILAITKTGASAYSVAVSNELFQYDVNSSGLINKIYVAGSMKDDDSIFTKDYTRAEATFSANGDRLGSVYLDEATKIFSVPAREAEVTDEDDIALATIDGIFQDGIAYDIDIYDNDTYPAVVVVYGAQAAIDVQSNVLLVTKVTKTTNAAGSSISKVYGLQAGEKVEGETSEDGVEYFDIEGAEIEYAIKAGDVVIFSLDAAGAINKVQVLMTLADAEAIMDGENEAFFATNDEDEYTNDVFGFVGEKKNGRVKLYDAIGGEIILDLDGEETSISLTNANVYEVNLKRSTPSFDEISSSDVLVEDREGKDAHWVYIRMYDDRAIDAVAYRFEIPEAHEA